MSSKAMKFELEADDQGQSSSEVIRPQPFVRLGSEIVETIEGEEDDNHAQDDVESSGLRDEREERSAAPPAEMQPFEIEAEGQSSSREVIRRPSVVRLAEIQPFEIEAEGQSSSGEVIRRPSFVRLGSEHLDSIEIQVGDTSASQDDVESTAGLIGEREERSTAPSAGWQPPKPRVVLQCFKVYTSVIILLINILAFAAGYAKKGKKVGEKDVECDRELWVNGTAVLIFLSTALSFGNGIDEPQVENRAWKKLRFLTVTLITALNVTFFIYSFEKERIGITPKEKEDYGVKQAIVVAISSFISTITPHVLLVKAREVRDMEIEETNPQSTN